MTGQFPSSKVDAVYGEIACRSAIQAERFLRAYNKSIFQDLTTQDDLIRLNRFWRLQLGRLPINTINERECLSDHSDFNAWLHNFREIVLPTILKYKLPLAET